MAQKTAVELIDDIDGGPADNTHRLTVDGKSVEIDLSDHNWAAFMQVAQVLLDKGRRIGGRTGRAGSAGARHAELEKVRAWAREHGYAVATRGRVPAWVMAEYRKSRKPPTF